MIIPLFGSLFAIGDFYWTKMIDLGRSDLTFDLQRKLTAVEPL